MAGAARLGLMFLGNMVGGPIGGAIGGVIGSMLFPERIPDQHSEGPRLTDLTFTGSGYAVGIPRIWGQYSAPGNVIWIGPINEHAHTEEEDMGSGKGGGGATYSYTTYSYSASIAVGLCRGPMSRVIKIVADNNTIYDATGESVDKEIDGLTWRFYAGDEDQLPDSIIEAHEGEGNVSAHRGLCYIVFDELDLTPFGNRVPQFQFIVQDAGPTFDFRRDYVELPFSPSINANLIVDYDLSRVYVFRGDEFTHVDLRSRVANDPLPVKFEHGGGYQNILCPGPDGTFVAFKAWGPTMGQRGHFYQVDGSTGEVLHEADFLSGVTWYNHGVCLAYANQMGDKRTILFTSGYWYNMNSVKPSSALIYDFETKTILVFASNFSPTEATARTDEWTVTFFTEKKRLSNAVEVTALVSLTTTTAEVRTIRVEDQPAPALFGGAPTFTPAAQIDTEFTFTVQDIDPSGRLTSFWGNPQIGAGMSNLDGIQYDPADGCYIVTANRGQYAVKFDGDGNIVWRIDTGVDNKIWAPYSPVWTNQRIAGGTFTMVSESRRLALYSTRTGEEVYESSLFQAGYAGGGYDAYNQVYIQHDRLTYLNAAENGSIPVAQIIQDISEDVGQTQHDYSNIGEFYVDGYLMAKPMQARAGIQPLASLYNFDAVDAGGYLRWVKRDNPSIATFAVADMVVVDEETGSVLDENRTQEMDLPQAVDVSYGDPDRDYEPNVAHAQRFTGNEGYETMRSRNKLSIEVPASISADVAKQAADVILMSAWIERLAQRFRLPPSAVLLDPGDVVTIDIPGQFPKDVLLMGQTIGADMSVEFSSVSQGSGQYTSYVQADPGQGFVPSVIVPPAASRLYMLPIPLLVDSHDQGRRNFVAYFGVGAYQSGWGNGTLQKRQTEDGWKSVATVQNAAPHGRITEPLPASDPGAVFCFQHAATMRVRMIQGALESVTFGQLLEGRNSCAVIHNATHAEVLQFLEAELQEDGSYLLSGLLRGRRGTDAVALTRQAPAGSSIVMLGETITGGAVIELADYTQTDAFRAFGSGQRPENGDVRSLVMDGYDLKPYAPWHCEVERDTGTGDITLTWVRRTRVRGQLRAQVDEVPLEEDFEAYEIDIFDGGMLRTVKVPTPTWTYTASAQGEDGFAWGGHFVVYQMSAQVGRGFPSQPIRTGSALLVSQESVFAIVSPPAAEIAVGESFLVAVSKLSNFRANVAQENITAITAYRGVTAQSSVSQFASFAIVEKE